MSQQTPRRWQWSLAILALGLAIGAGVVFATTPKPKVWSTIAGRPLLAAEGESFDDRQVGLFLIPPPDWSMQVRSTEAPEHKPERMLVKYKRVQPKLASAWLRVRMSDQPEEVSLVAFLKKRKPSEPQWVSAGDIEENHSIGGLPAAKSTWSGPYDVDGRGNKEYLREVFAVRRGGTIFEFSGTWLRTDSAARDQFHAAMQTVRFQ